MGTPKFGGVSEVATEAAILAGYLFAYQTFAPLDANVVR